MSKIKGLNTFFVLIFVVFVADGPHFYQMFKMVLIFVVFVADGPHFYQMFKMTLICAIRV